MSEKKKVPYIIQYPADYAGCGFWRMLWPQLMMNMKGIATVCHSQMFIRDFLHYNFATAIHVQRQITPFQLTFFKKLHALKKRMNFRLIYDIDDIIFPDDIPDYNDAKEKIKQAGFYAKEIIELCDEMTVSTPYLRDYYLNKTNQKNITVIPNYAPLFWLGDHFSEELLIRNFRMHKKKPRILYAGASSHFHVPAKGEQIPDDFTHVKDAIMANADQFKWVFVGAFPRSLCQHIKAGIIEYYPWKTLDEYPRFLSKLEINMCIAPLQENDFNRGKSDLKFLEATALGLPIACQDLCTYSVAPIKFSSGEDMIKKIRETLETEDTFLEASRRARVLIEGRWLEREENIGKYIDVYTYPYGHPMRKYV